MSAGQRTEEATPRRLQKAREKGDVPQSRDLTSSLLLLVGFLVLSYQLEDLANIFQSLFRACFSAAVAPNLSNAMALQGLASAILQGLLAVLPILLAAAAVGFLGSFLQVGALLAFEPVKPQLTRLNPLAGLKRLFFSKETYIELLKAALKVVIVGFLCWGVIWGAFRTIVLLSTQELPVIAKITAGVIGSCVKRTLLFFLALSVLDVFFQRWQYRQRQRMTKQEVKEEYKEQEGDPEHRGRRKRMHEEIATDTMLQSVRKANVIVTNPEHIACAIRYDPEEEDAPRLLAKGRGYLAQKIKEIAGQEDIPIVRDISLAHALYQMQLDDQIPEELFEAVGEVLRWVELLARSEGKDVVWRKPAAPPAE